MIGKATFYKEKNGEASRFYVNVGEMEKKEKTRKSRKKELREWIILLSIIGFLYFTGLHVPVAAFIQRMVVGTGVVQPDLDQSSTQASYDLLLEDLDGNVVSLETLKGQTIFINFWATWCPPCVAEMPDIHELYLEVKDEVAFVMLSRDNDENKVKQWIAKKGYEFPVYFARSPIPQVYYSNSIPTTYVLSPAGEVKLKQSGMAKYNTSKFKSYLAKLRPPISSLPSEMPK